MLVALFSPVKFFKSIVFGVKFRSTFELVVRKQLFIAVAQCGKCWLTKRDNGVRIPGATAEHFFLFFFIAFPFSVKQSLTER